jgi:hypothetical protein
LTQNPQPDLPDDLPESTEDAVNLEEEKNVGDKP